MKSLGELAALVDGNVVGDPEIRIHGAETIRDAVDGEITLADHSNLKTKLNECRASAVVVSDAIATSIPSIVVEDVHVAFEKIVAVFRTNSSFTTGSIHPRAIVADSASIADDVTIHPNAVIGKNVVIESGAIIHSGVSIMVGCRIGAGTQIFPNAVLYENTIVGKRCLIHAGAMIGAYGFGYDSSSGTHQLSAQVGYVLLGDDVEVGAGTTIDRGTYGATRIGEGTKIDNLVQVAHNVYLGKHNLICSQVGIAGSCSTGDYVVMAGQVGMADHLHIGTGVTIGAKTGIIRDITEKGVYFGTPCYPHREKMKQLSAIRKLPNTMKEIKQMKADIDRLLADMGEAQQTSEGSDPASNSRTSAA